MGNNGLTVVAHFIHTSFLRLQMSFKRIYIAAILSILTLPVIASAQDSVITNMTLSGRSDQLTVVQLSFGIKKGATNGYDQALGEKSRFPAFPPSGLDGSFYFTDTTILHDTIPDNDSLYIRQVWSQSDYRGFENGSKFFKKFNLKIPFGSQRQDADPKLDYKDFNIRWGEISPYIDSAFIRDKYTGKIVNINLKDSNEALYTNQFIDELEVIVYYSVIPSSVEDFKNEIPVKNELSIYPNPVHTIFYINSESSDVEYSIYSNSGQKVQSGKYIPLKAIDVENLPDGMYSVIITAGDTKKIQRFVKQK
jgi:hypothetical protein